MAEIRQHAAQAALFDLALEKRAQASIAKHHDPDTAMPAQVLRRGNDGRQGLGCAEISGDKYAKTRGQF